MEGYEDKLEKLKRCVAGIEQRGKECLSLLSFSEGLLKRDINLVRTRIDLRVKNLEKKALNDLGEMYLREKENIYEVLTNTKFILERAFTFSNDEEVLRETECKLMNESKKVTRKQFVLESNEGLFSALEEMKTFGKIIVKYLKETKRNNIRNGGTNITNVYSIQDSLDRTNNGVKNSQDEDFIQNEIRIELNEHEREHCRLNADIDPFAILRSMKEDSGKGIYDSNDHKNGATRNKDVPVQSSKHVRFSDDVASTNDFLRLTKNRGRTVITRWEQMKRARSASPRAHYQTSIKEDLPNGILKNKTFDSSEVPIREHSSRITTSSRKVNDRHDKNHRHIQDNLDRKLGTEIHKSRICSEGDPRTLLFQGRDIKLKTLMSQKPCVNWPGNDITKNGNPVHYNNGSSQLSNQQYSEDMPNTRPAKEPKSKHISFTSATDKRRRNRSISTDISKVLGEAREQYQEFTDFNDCIANEVNTDQQTIENGTHKDNSHATYQRSCDGLLDKVNDSYVTESARHVPGKTETSRYINIKDSNNEQITTSFPVSSPMRTETNGRLRLPSFDEMLYTN